MNSLIASSLANPVYGEDPIVMMKAVKNETEQEGFRIAHHKDAAAVIRFWKWLEETLPETQVTEVSAADKLHDFRAEQPGFWMNHLQRFLLMERMQPCRIIIQILNIQLFLNLKDCIWWIREDIIRKEQPTLPGHLS